MAWSPELSSEALTLIILAAWSLWKHWNNAVFNGANTSIQVILRKITEEVHLWCLAEVLFIWRSWLIDWLVYLDHVCVFWCCCKLVFFFLMQWYTDLLPIWEKNHGPNTMEFNNFAKVLCFFFLQAKHNWNYIASRNTSKLWKLVVGDYSLTGSGFGEAKWEYRWM